MADRQKLGIGEFALVTGLSVPRLRRYHDLGLKDLGRIVAGGENAAGLLRRHRRRLLEQIVATNRMIDLVDQLIREERSMANSLQLVEVILRVEDVDATVAFYRDVFGMDFQADDHNGTLPLHYDACGGSWEPEGFFMFTIFPTDGQPTKTYVGFGVPDLDETWRRAQAHNATEIAPPTDSGYMPRQAIFEDNAGNRVNVYHRGEDW